MNKIKDRYHELGYNRITFARELDISPITLWRWEKGRCNMGAYNRDLLCQILGATPSELGIDLLTMAKSQKEKE
jgi:DNA-binding XRE family transcriptional regulator